MRARRGAGRLWRTASSAAAGVGGAPLPQEFEELNKKARALFVAGMIVVFCGMALLIPRPPPAAPARKRTLDDAPPVRGLSQPSGRAPPAAVPHLPTLCRGRKSSRASRPRSCRACWRRRNPSRSVVCAKRPICTLPGSTAMLLVATPLDWARCSWSSSPRARAERP